MNDSTDEQRTRHIKCILRHRYLKLRIMVVLCLAITIHLPDNNWQRFKLRVGNNAHASVLVLLIAMYVYRQINVYIVFTLYTTARQSLNIVPCTNTVR